LTEGNAVGQLGFYDVDKRLKAISAKGDPLETLNAIIPFESFRVEIEAVVRLAPEERKSNAGRKPFDAVMMFKVLVLQALYNLADEQVEYQIRDRLSFARFLGLGLEDVVPDATTVWLFREALTKAGLVKALFERFNRHLDAKGYIARGGQIIDATIVSAPKQHNTREENEAIKAGKTPKGWEEKPAKNAQKDQDARWTKKNEQSFYGYKNHISIDRKHKFIRRYAETDASVHDSQKLDEVLDKSNTSKDVWADSAYRSAEIEAKLKAKGYKSRIHRRGARNHSLCKRQQAANTTRSRVRVRVEHVFGDQENAMGGKFVRTIGIARACAKIGLMNLVYNMRRFMQLERMATASA
jgi:transposase, IS5 family